MKAPVPSNAVLNTFTGWFIPCLLLIAAQLLWPAGQARADWVNLGGAEVARNIVEFRVDDDGVNVVLEIFVEDLAIFADLVPAAWLAQGGVQAAPDEQRLARFAEKGLVITTGDGTVLPAELITVERRKRIDRASPLAGSVDPYSGRMLPKPPDDPRVLYVELFYPFTDGPPDVLNINPPLGADGTAAATIGMVLFHRAIPVNDFRFLSGPATLRLDWSDPWYSRFDNPNLKRHHSYPRMAFLYAEPYEMREEALVRVRDAAELVGMEISGSELTAEQAEQLIALTAEKIGNGTQLSIDGAPATADFDRGAYMRIGMRGLELLQPGEPVNVDADILGLIWSAPTDGLPGEARLEWSWFDETAPEITAYSIDAAGPFLWPLTPQDPVLVWTNHFKQSPYPEIAEVRVERDQVPMPFLAGLGAVTVLGLVIAAIGYRGSRQGGRKLLVGGLAIAVLAALAIPAVMLRQSTQVPDLDEESLATLTGDLLNNVYRSFDFREEDQVYDRLALTLDGAMLEKVYLDQRAALRVERAGGADARVNKLDVVSVERLPDAEPGSIGLRAEWVIQGSVGHWGHLHSRSNSYQADIIVQPVDGNWKITAFDVLSQERLL